MTGIPVRGWARRHHSGSREGEAGWNPKRDGEPAPRPPSRLGWMSFSWTDLLPLRCAPWCQWRQQGPCVLEAEPSPCACLHLEIESKQCGLFPTSDSLAPFSGTAIQTLAVLKGPGGAGPQQGLTELKEAPVSPSWLLSPDGRTDAHCCARDRHPGGVQAQARPPSLRVLATGHLSLYFESCSFCNDFQKNQCERASVSTAEKSEDWPCR